MMSIIGTIYEDVTTDVLGVIGIWQVLVTIIVTLLMMPTMFYQYEDMFLLKPSKDISCVVPEHLLVTNSTLCTFTTSSNLTEEMICDRWKLKLMWIFWLKKTWLIFCSDKLKLLSTTMICRLGFIFGCVIFGLVADSFGRKKTIIINLTAESIFRLILTFCDSETWFRLIIFLRSLFASANFYMGIVLISEIASNSWRTHLIVIVSTPRVLANVCTVPLVNIFPNLETFNFMACFACILCMALIRLLPESPQWLLYNQKIPAAENLLYKAAIKNRIQLCSDFKIRPVDYKAYNCLDESRTCVTILCTYNTRVIIISTLMFWTLYYFLWSLLYVKAYTDNQNLHSLEVLGIFVPLGCLTLLLLKKLKLKHLLLTNITVMGTLTACIFVMNRIHTESAALGIGMIGHIILLCVTPRLFAINVRATIFGCCHSLGQLGAVVCYIIFYLGVVDNMALILIQIGSTFVLTALCYLIPDVDERELPDVIEDMDYFSELSKPLRWATQKTTSPSHEEVEMRIYSFSSEVRNPSTNSYAIERIPAQPIGFKKFWNVFLFLSSKLR